MAEKIRLRVWVLGMAPIVLVGVIFALVLAPRKDAHKAAPSGTPLAGEPEPDPSPQGIPTQARPTPTASVVASAVAPAPTMTLSVDPYGSVVGPPPEPIPELDPMALRPPGSQSWSPEQKAAYKQQMFDKMDDRERTLQSEIAAAHRAGDTATEQRKRLTLEYLRHKRADIERFLARAAQAPSPPSSPPPPGPSAPGEQGDAAP